MARLAIDQVDSIREWAYFEFISLVATGRHPLHGLLQHVERFDRIPTGGMRCASTRPESVAPDRWAPQGLASGHPSTVTSSGG